MSHERVLNLLLTHQRAQQMEAMLAWWRRELPEAAVLLVVSRSPGDRGDEFARLAFPDKIAVDDPRLCTRDHVRERQSYSAVFAAAARWLADRPEFDYVHFAEYDHLPLVADLNERQVAALRREGADVLGYCARRLDGTSHAIWLNHSADPGLAEFFAARSVRADPRVVLSMFGSGSFWTRAAFEATAAAAEPSPIFLELWLPTVAHHLGFRVRPFRDPEACSHVLNLGDFHAEIDAARAVGAWTIHPVKSLWN